MTTLVEADGTVSRSVGRERIETLLEAGDVFWLDVLHPGADDFALFSEVFGFHPLAVEDSQTFDQRSKLDNYGDLCVPRRLRLVAGRGRARGGALLLYRAVPCHRPPGRCARDRHPR